MKFHFCPLNKDCRKYGAPARFHITTNKRNIGIALTPSARFVETRKGVPQTHLKRYDPKNYKVRWISVVPYERKVHA